MAGMVGMAERQKEWSNGRNGVNGVNGGNGKNGGNGGTAERMAEWQNGRNGYICTIYGTHRRLHRHQRRRQRRHLLINYYWPIASAYRTLHLNNINLIKHVKRTTIVRASLVSKRCILPCWTNQIKILPFLPSTSKNNPDEKCVCRV